jgi:hypothetical protein
VPGSAYCHLLLCNLLSIIKIGRIISCYIGFCLGYLGYLIPGWYPICEGGIIKES